MSSKTNTAVNVKYRKTRTNLEKKDADILCQILKTLEDGHIWKVIKERVGTKQEMFLAWEKVTKLFNESTDRDLTRQQSGHSTKGLNQRRKRQQTRRDSRKESLTDHVRRQVVVQAQAPYLKLMEIVI